MDNHTIADELEVAYDRCKLWPEHTGDGFMALLELRNLTPDILAALRAPSPAPMGGDVGGDDVERAVIVCPQCDGEGSYADGLDEAACSTDCTRCGSNGWIVDRAALAAMPVQAPVADDVANQIMDLIDERVGVIWYPPENRNEFKQLVLSRLPTQPQPDDVVERERLLAAVRELADVCGDWNGISDETNAIYEEAIRAGGRP